MERLDGVRDALETERDGLIDRRSVLSRGFAEQLEDAADSYNKEADELAQINERARAP